MPDKPSRGDMVQERRAAKRYPTTPDRQETILKVGDATFPARIHDESATGYALQVDGHPAVYEGEQVWLRHEGGWSACHVMSIVPHTGGCRVGLARQAEVNTLEFQQLEKQHKSARHKRVHRVQARQIVPLVIGVALLITWFLVPLLRTGRFEPLGFLALREESSSAPVSQEDETPADASLEYRLRQMGAEAFTTPDLKRILRLSPAQSRQMTEIAERWRRTLDMARRSGAEGDAVRKLSLQAQQEAVSVLSSAQRQRWTKMLELAEQRPE